MFEEFVKMIASDPIMMVLCGAIALLVVIFIIILIFGGKKKEKIIEDKVEDNTTTLLKSDIDNEPLKSTQEFTLNNISANEMNLQNTLNVPELDAIEDIESEKVAPISIDEALSLKEAREDDAVKNTIEIPVLTESPVTPVQVSAPTYVEPVKPAFTEPTVMPEPIVSEPVMPAFEQPKVEIPTPIVEQPFSSVYVSQESNPIPQTVQAQPEPITQEPEEIDLPKLNVDNSTSVLSSLAGEEYNLR